MGPLECDEVEVAVEHCGVCHSDLSVVDDEWGLSSYPLVPGHEVIGRITALGPGAKGLRVGQRVGVGWNAASCMHCSSCARGEHHLCASVQPTILGHHGGFAERVRAHWFWVVPLADTLEAAAAGSLLCGEITVFAPLLLADVRPTQRIGVIGIGGLGHLAVRFARAWGCEVTAFTSSDAKRDDALRLGAHRVVSSRDSEQMRKIAGSLDPLICTVNVALDWAALMTTLAPKGRLHVVGALLDAIPVNAMGMIVGQQSIAGSPTGSRASMDAMLVFAACHGILPTIERFPMRRVNDALEHLRAGKARYRIVLDADFT